MISGLASKNINKEITILKQKIAVATNINEKRRTITKIDIANPAQIKENEESDCATLYGTQNNLDTFKLRNHSVCSNQGEQEFRRTPIINCINKDSSHHWREPKLNNMSLGVEGKSYSSQNVEMR
mmetsp:Transcript_24547/g.21786  ORF Transcript_24547/g.21786 Transcript_24547/m.21786 type:complete len:125 (-) Transcript_24547:36-410(-)